MEWIKDALPFLIPLVTAILGWFGSRALQGAKVAKTEAEAKKTLAEAEKMLAEADSEEARNMTSIIGAWRTLYDQVKLEMSDIRDEQDRARIEHNRVLAELRRYKRGVDILIKQLRELGVEPRWTPDMDGGKDGK